MMAVAVVDEGGLDVQWPKQGKHLNTSDWLSVSR
jgi:hypothetical protein